MEREKVIVYIEKCDPEARIPEYSRPGDAGMDVFAVCNVIIPPQETVLVKTGLKVAITEGYEIQIRPRSGLSLKTPLRIPNSPGTIDAGYRDEIGVIISNTSLTESYEIKKGDRIAQMVIQRVPMIQWVTTESVSARGQDRGGGFGSSGR